MFTKYPNIFSSVKRKMKNNIAVGNIKKYQDDRSIDQLLDQVIFETLCEYEYVNK